MSSRVSSSTSTSVASVAPTASLPTVEEFNDLDRSGIKRFLQKRKDGLDLDDNEIDIIYNNKIDGKTFLDLTQRDLIDIKIAIKPAKEIVKLIPQIRRVQPTAGLIRSRSPSLNEDRDTLKRRRLMKEYNETVDIGLKANSPSVGAIPENFFRDQQENPILNGRPLANIGPPITIYSDVFGLFLSNFNDEDLPIPDDFLTWADKLILEATDSYRNEEERNIKIRATLSEKLGPILLVEYGTKRQKCKSDGVITTSIGNLLAYLGIFEGKNEIGKGQNDPAIQGALYYRDYWSQDDVKKIRDQCCAPSFIIIMAGPWFCILGGVFLNRAVVEPLTDLIPLTVNLRVFNKQKRIARLFYSLSNALQELSSFYIKLSDIKKSVEQRFFPYVRQYQSNGTNHISFTYICELSNDPIRTIWKAVDEFGKSIVVKFTTKYCKDAHKLCAESGFAPDLIYHSDDNEVEQLGGFIMIIMEYIDGTSLDQRFYDRNTIDKTYGLTIYRDVKCAIDILHDEDLVFADLRYPNILTFETNDTPQANLIDFDWSGEDNVDIYPSSMNMDIPWPPGANPCAKLKKEHDLYWLDELRKFLRLSEDEVTNEALDDL